jgi:maleylacetate reductase
MQPFVYTASPVRVIFGFGTLGELSAEVDRLGLKRILVLSTPNGEARAKSLSVQLGDRSCGIYAGAIMHTPIAVTQDALRIVSRHGADGIVAIGGGSTTGLGKALAWRAGIKQIVVPTTYSGSEMTPILGETVNGSKVTRSDPKILPDTVIYDVDLTLSLSPTLSATSGINAIAHAVEALYAHNRDPITSLMALEAIHVMYHALPAIAADAGNRSSRSDALYAAWLCGACLGSVGMSLHHKLCHTLGGSFKLPHAETHTVVLPHALAYNAPAIPEIMTQLNRTLDVPDAAQALYDLAGRLGAVRSLAALGMRDDGIDRAADEAMASPYWNPRELRRDTIRDLIARAHAGSAPLS